MRRSPRRSPLLVVLTLVAVAFVGSPAADAKPKGGSRSSAEAPYAGFRTPRSAAGGGFLGARKVGSAVVYRIDPARKRAATAFGAPDSVALLDGGGKRRVTVNDTQRAAWIVSKYGSRNNDVQAAAVEVALDDLLVGGPYALKGRTTSARLAGLSKRGKIVTFATKMLKGSRLRAGDYQVTLQAPPSVDPGGTVNARLQVLATASGLPVPSLSTTFAFPGESDQTVDTGPDGVATAIFSSGGSGPVSVAARVSQLPENKLVVLTPTTSRASRVVVAQVKSERTLSTPVVVRAQGAAIVTSAKAEVASPSAVPARIVLTGAYPGAAPRPVRATLYGPNPGAAGCTGAPARTTTLPAGSTSLTAGAAVIAEGWYAWRVDIDADAFNTAVSTCGGATFVRQPTVQIGPSTDPKYNTTVRIARLATTFSGTGLMHYYAAPPTGQPACSQPQREQREFTVAADAAGNATFSFTLPAAVYAIRFDLPGAGLDNCVRTPG